jgi:hypothetical protein
MILPDGKLCPRADMPQHWPPCPLGCCRGLVRGVVVWLAGHAHLSCLISRQWITIGIDIHLFIHSQHWPHTTPVRVYFTQCAVRVMHCTGDCLHAILLHTLLCQPVVPPVASLLLKSQQACIRNGSSDNHITMLMQTKCNETVQTWTTVRSQPQLPASAVQA